MNNLLEEIEVALSYHSKKKISKYDVLLGDEKLLKLIVSNVDNKYKYEQLYKEIKGLIEKDLKNIMFEDFKYNQGNEDFSQIDKEIIKILTKIENNFVKEELLRLALSPKKMLRAKMYLKMASDNDYHSAALIELFHLATLIQDDVIDKANIRRFTQTINSKYDDRTAILLADYLLVEIGFNLSKIGIENKKASNEASEEIKKFFKNLINDFLSSLLESENDVYTIKSNSQYEQYAINKTAKFFQVVLVCGLLKKDNKCSLAEIHTTIDFATTFGLLFQKVDDLIDYQGDAKNYGKEARDVENNINNFIQLNLKNKNIDEIKEELNNEINSLYKEELGQTFKDEINYLTRRVNE